MQTLRGGDQLLKLALSHTDKYLFRLFPQEKSPRQVELFFLLCLNLNIIRQEMIQKHLRKMRLTSKLTSKMAFPLTSYQVQKA